MDSHISAQDEDILGDFEDFIMIPSADDDVAADQLEDELVDHEQNIARASFGDMVNDFERNELFYKAIRKSVETLRERNDTKAVHALDIGCGTGLLSMMAVRSGADKVTACDTFRPIADCARDIVKRNGMSEKINIISKQSNLLQFESNDTKPNLLVAELLDTELIGEGCLFAYRDAVKRLTSSDALYVPSKARIYIQLVQSEQLFRHHHFRKCFAIKHDAIRINTPKLANNCFGSHILYDIQMNRLKPGVDFEILSQPQVVFEFEFNKLDSLKLNDCKRIRIPLIREFDQPILVFSWWDLDMDFAGDIVLSCGPYWARGFEREEEIAWRDHWMQTIYYLPAFAFVDNDLDGFDHRKINENKSLVIDAFHDPFSLWFDLPPDQNNASPLDASGDGWSCHCGLHSHISRNRLCAINDERQYSVYWEAFRTQIDRHKLTQSNSLNLVYLGDESIIPLLFAAHRSIERIIVRCQDVKCYRFFAEFLQENAQLESKVTLCKSTDFVSTLATSDTPIDGIISELYFQNFDRQLPSLEYFDLLRTYQEPIRKCLRSRDATFITLPHKLVLKCLLVEFRDFWRSFADVGTDIEGFDLSQYDTLIQNARQNVDWSIEPHLLWQYSCKPLTEKAIELFEWQLSTMIPDSESQLTKAISFDLSNLEHRLDDCPRWREKVAIVVWTEHWLDDAGKFVISGGPQTPEPWPLSEELRSWNRAVHQCVGFLGKRWSSLSSNENRLQLTFSFSYLEKSLSFIIGNK